MNLLNSLVLILVSLFLGLLGLYVVLKLARSSAQNIFVGLSGLIIGLIIGSLLSVPLSNLPGIYGQWLPIIISLISIGISMAIMISQKEVISNLFSGIGNLILSFKPSFATNNEILVDTSVLIDGRLVDIVKSGFIFGKIIVPAFVLQELQLIADKGDKLKRERGKRGLKSLETLKNKYKVKIEILEEDALNNKDVDNLLMEIAKKRNANIITTDFNLNRVAKLRGVKVLNINELVAAIKTVVLPGEQLIVKVVQPGKEKGQGLGYLPDGTMIVVEDGDKVIGQEVSVEVSRVYQTLAGKMIFTKLLNKGKI
jgi:uncharacterized protein YacL